MPFDVVHRFAATAIARTLALPMFDDAERPVGILVGNSRTLWTALAAALAADPELAASSDPIERFAEEHITRYAAQHAGRVWFAHRQYDGAYLPFQRIAAAAGLAALAPTNLLVHPIYGPWFALRAIVLVPGEPPPPPVAATKPCVCTDHGCVAAFEHAREQPDDWRRWLAMRDACPVGRVHRYTDQQIAYHYTKDRHHLPIAGGADLPPPRR